MVANFKKTSEVMSPDNQSKKRGVERKRREPIFQVELDAETLVEAETPALLFIWGLWEKGGIVLSSEKNTCFSKSADIVDIDDIAEIVDIVDNVGNMDKGGKVSPSVDNCGQVWTSVDWTGWKS